MVPLYPTAQLVEQWFCNMAILVRHQGDVLVPFSKALILITRSFGEDLKPSVLWLPTNKHLGFLSKQVKSPLLILLLKKACVQVCTCKLATNQRDLLLSLQSEGLVADE